MKFLSSLRCYKLSSQSLKGLGAVIGNCKWLSTIEVEDGDDSICYLLEQVRNPSKCSLTIGLDTIGAHLTSVGAEQLATLLPRFNSVVAFNVDLRDCCASALNALVATITHETLKQLTLQGIILTPAVTKALGRSLPGMLSLQGLELTGFDGGILQAERMEALFGGFNKTMPLSKLTFSGFNVRGCLAPLMKSLPFFPSLRQLNLKRLNIDEHDQCSLLKSFGSLTRLEVRIDTGRCPDSFNYYVSMDDKTLQLGVISLTPQVAAMLGRLLPEMSLQVFELTGDFLSSTLQAKKMEALFGGFNKTLPLYELTFSHLSVDGRLAPLFRSLRFFPNLVRLQLERLNMDGQDLRGLLESFQFIPNLQELYLSGNPLGHTLRPIVPHVINLKHFRILKIANTGHSLEDLTYVRDAVQQALPEVAIIWERRSRRTLRFSTGAVFQLNRHLNCTERRTSLNSEEIDSESHHLACGNDLLH